MWRDEYVASPQGKKIKLIVIFKDEESNRKPFIFNPKQLLINRPIDEESRADLTKLYEEASDSYDLAHQALTSACDRLKAQDETASDRDTDFLISASAWYHRVISNPQVQFNRKYDLDFQLLRTAEELMQIFSRRRPNTWS